MGNNAKVEDVAATMKALGQVLTAHGVSLEVDLEQAFMEAL